MCSGYYNDDENNVNINLIATGILTEHGSFRNVRDMEVEWVLGFKI
jgi:hypothetical protein